MRRAKMAIIRQLQHITVGFTASRDDFAGGYYRLFAVVFLRYAEHLVNVTHYYDFNGTTKSSEII